jgi:TonB family protein
MKTLFIIPLLLLSLLVRGQMKASVQQCFEERTDNRNNRSPEQENEKPVIQVKEQPNKNETLPLYYNRAPEFPGGNKALKKFIKKNARYPQSDSVLEGTVVLQFWVLEDGKLVDTQVIRSTDKRLDQSAIDLILKMPKWTPGNDGIRNMRVKYTLPIRFPLSVHY